MKPLVNEHVTREITRLRDAIKKKYREMRFGELDTELMLSKQYSPILKELSKIQSPIVPKTEFKSEISLPTKPSTPSPAKTPKPSSSFAPQFIDTDVILETPKPSTSFTPQFVDTDVVVETPDLPPDITDVLSTPEGRNQSEKWIDENFKHPFTRKYMKKMPTDTKRVIDHTYGPRIEDDGIMIGTEPLQFTDEGEIVIDDVNYKGTRGLYELIFKRIPNVGDYTDADLEAYKDICIKTSAHKQKYNPRGQINRNPRSDKYKRVIQYLFPPVGKGYSYWDDPNELCERLRLLLASQNVGHTGHSNEIAEIIEELREAGLIKGLGNRKIRALTK